MKLKVNTGNQEVKKNTQKIEKYRKQNQGITLIALVVTIVVLLILAGITLVMVLGENGIINQAKIAKEKQKESEYLDQLSIAVINSKVNTSYNINLDTLETQINQIQGTIEKQGEDENLPWAVTFESEYKFRIEENGNIAKIDPNEKETVTLQKIIKAEDKSQYYGKYVEYTVQDSKIQQSLETADIKWRIFYAGNDFSTDGRNKLYLMASDYVPYEALPASSKGTLPNKGDTSRAAYFKNIVDNGDYKGSENITNKELQKLNQKFFDYLASNNTASSYANMQTVAYMLDTNIWNGYQGKNADYAIGAPTVELLFRSYNQIYQTDYQTKVDAMQGYRISKDGGQNWWYQYPMLDINDSLYVIASDKNAKSCWIASPAEVDEGNQKYIYEIHLDGQIACIAYYNWNGNNPYNKGFRPIICLNSSTILEKQEDGNFKIK